MLEKVMSVMKDRTNYVIDIGTSDCPPGDIMYQFTTSDNFKGLCVEANPQHLQTLKNTLSKNFAIYNNYINPENVIEVFKYFNVPESPDILKIDIDGYDLSVIREILKVYKPKVIICEINEKIPPPVVFEVKYKRDYAWDFSHHFGFSLAAGDKVMAENSYKIVTFCDLNNIMCINRDLCDSLNLDYKSDIMSMYKYEYIMKDRSSFWWNEDVNHWLDITDTDALRKEICNYFETMNPRSNMTVKTKIRNIDFILD
jgi:hypothetical protein